jgi:hypothetical protein
MRTFTKTTASPTLAPSSPSPTSATDVALPTYHPSPIPTTPPLTITSSPSVPPTAVPQLSCMRDAKCFNDAFRCPNPHPHPHARDRSLRNSSAMRSSSFPSGHGCSWGSRPTPLPLKCPCSTHTPDRCRRPIPIPYSAYCRPTTHSAAAGRDGMLGARTAASRTTRARARNAGAAAPFRSTSAAIRAGSTWCAEPNHMPRKQAKRRDPHAETDTRKEHHASRSLARRTRRATRARARSARLHSDRA